MVWVVILLVLVTLLMAFLLAPLEFFIDTRIGTIYFRWMVVGHAIMLHEKNEWWLKVRVLFFEKKWKLTDFVIKKRARKKTLTRHSKEKKRIKFSSGRILSVLTTFRVARWQAALDTGDNILNAWLYPLNFFPVTGLHLFVNFTDSNYVSIKLKNRPLRMIYAWFNY